MKQSNYKQGVAAYLAAVFNCDLRLYVEKLQDRFPHLGLPGCLDWLALETGGLVIQHGSIFPRKYKAFSLDEGKFSVWVVKPNASHSGVIVIPRETVGPADDSVGEALGDLPDGRISHMVRFGGRAGNPQGLTVEVHLISKEIRDLLAAVRSIASRESGDDMVPLEFLVEFLELQRHADDHRGESPQRTRSRAWQAWDSHYGPMLYLAGARGLNLHGHSSPAVLQAMQEFIAGSVLQSQNGNAADARPSEAHIAPVSEDVPRECPEPAETRQAVTPVVSRDIDLSGSRGELRPWVKERLESDIPPANRRALYIEAQAKFPEYAANFASFSQYCFVHNELLTPEQRAWVGSIQTTWRTAEVSLLQLWVKNRLESADPPASRKDLYAEALHVYGTDSVGSFPSFVYRAFAGNDLLTSEQRKWHPAPAPRQAPRADRQQTTDAQTGDERLRRWVKERLDSGSPPVDRRALYVEASQVFGEEFTGSLKSFILRVFRFNGLLTPEQKSWRPAITATRPRGPMHPHNPEPPELLGEARSGEERPAEAARDIAGDELLSALNRLIGFYLEVSARPAELLDRAVQLPRFCGAYPPHLLRGEGRKIRVVVLLGLKEASERIKNECALMTGRTYYVFARYYKIYNASRECPAVLPLGGVYRKSLGL